MTEKVKGETENFGLSKWFNAQEYVRGLESFYSRMEILIEGYYTALIPELARRYGSAEGQFRFSDIYGNRYIYIPRSGIKPKEDTNPQFQGAVTKEVVHLFLSCIDLHSITLDDLREFTTFANNLYSIEEINTSFPSDLHKNALNVLVTYIAFYAKSRIDTNSAISQALTDCEYPYFHRLEESKLRDSLPKGFNIEHFIEELIRLEDDMDIEVNGRFIPLRTAPFNIRASSRHRYKIRSLGIEGSFNDQDIQSYLFGRIIEAFQKSVRDQDEFNTCKLNIDYLWPINQYVKCVLNLDDLLGNILTNIGNSFNAIQMKGSHETRWDLFDRAVGNYLDTLTDEYRVKTMMEFGGHE